MLVMLLVCQGRLTELANTVPVFSLLCILLIVIFHPSLISLKFGFNLGTGPDGSLDESTLLAF